MPETRGGESLWNCELSGLAIGSPFLVRTIRACEQKLKPLDKDYEKLTWFFFHSNWDTHQTTQSNHTRFDTVEKKGFKYLINEDN